MTRKTFELVMTAALLTAAAATAFAADDGTTAAEVTTVTTVTADKPSSFGGTAPYVSAGGVYAIEQDSHFAGDLSNSGGYDLRLGYNFPHMIAAEIEWQSLLNFSRNTLDPVTNNPDPSIEARMLSLNGRISPLDGRFQPYGLAGMGWYNVQADRVSVSLHESSFALKFGVGVLAYFTERLGFALEAAYIIPMTGELGGGDRFDLIPITGSFFFRFK